MWVAVAARMQVDRLRHVDDPGPVGPPEHVVRGQVAVHEVAVEQELDVLEQALERLLRARRLELDVPELRGRARLVAHVLHQDRVVRGGEGVRHARARVVQATQRLPFPFDPGVVRHAPALLGARLHGAPRARVEHHAIARVAVRVPERPEFPGSIHLRREQLDARRGVRAAAIHRRFLAVADHAEHVRDQALPAELLHDRGLLERSQHSARERGAGQRRADSLFRHIDLPGEEKKTSRRPTPATRRIPRQRSV